MRYVWEAGQTRRVMHIECFTSAGEGTMAALCRIPLHFDRSINAPFALGRKVCKRCEEILTEDDS